MRDSRLDIDLEQLPQFFELSNNQGIRGTGDSNLRVPPYSPINREIELQDLYDEYLRAFDLLDSTPLATLQFAVTNFCLLENVSRSGKGVWKFIKVT